MISIFNLLVLVSFAVLGASAYFDYKSKNIPNKITIPFLLLGILIFIYAGRFDLIWVPLLVSVFFMALELKGFFGMADVKLLAAISLLFPSWFLMLLIVITTFAFILVYAAFRKQSSQRPFAVFLFLSFAVVFSYLYVTKIF